MNPLITVIIPLYNGEKFIGDAVQSVIDQQYAPLEIIVVDDGSTDNGAAVTAALGADVRLIRQQNAGAAAARNRGISEARGELIAFLDADDLFPPGKLHAQVAYFRQTPEAEIVTGYVQLICLLGAESSVAHAPNQMRNAPSLTMNLGAALFRRAVFERVGGFDETLPFAEDFDWWLRADEVGVCMYALRRLTLFYRRHGSNVTATNTLKTIHNYGNLVVRRAETRRGAPINVNHFLDWTRLLEPPPAADPPLVSIIIPAHTAADLESTLASVLEQDYERWEILVITTADVAAVMSERLPQVQFLDQPNLDPIAARNYGVEVARGELIAFLNPGDVWMLAKLSRQVTILLENPSVEFLLCGVDIVLPSSARLDAWIEARWLSEPHLVGIFSTLVARRSALERVGQFDPKYTSGSDLDWYVRAMDLQVTWLPIPQMLTQRHVTDPERIARHYEQLRREIALIHRASIKRRQNEQKYRTT